MKTKKGKKKKGKVIPSQSLSSSYSMQSLMPSHRRDQGCTVPSEHVKVVTQGTFGKEIIGVKKNNMQEY